MSTSWPTAAWAPILLLVGSNVFMTFAWYGHLKFKTTTLLTAVMVSWLIALPEYVLQVPANRLGHGYYSAAQLKTIQEVITLSVFCVFSVTYLVWCFTLDETHKTDGFLFRARRKPQP